MARIDYYYTVLSPFTYLAGDRLEKIAAAHDATIVHHPVNIGALFEHMGGTPPAKRHPARMDYRAQDLPRLAKRSGLPFNLHPAHWPTDQVPVSTILIEAAGRGIDVGPALRAAMGAVWAEDRQIGDWAVAEEIAAAHGIGADIVAAAKETGAAKFEAETKAAMEAGVFGSPFYIVEGERFWGQDRLDHLEMKLAGDL